MFRSVEEKRAWKDVSGVSHSTRFVAGSSFSRGESSLIVKDSFLSVSPWRARRGSNTDSCFDSFNSIGTIVEINTWHSIFLFTFSGSYRCGPSRRDDLSIERNAADARSFYRQVTPMEFYIHAP